jgi:hypothetical protein
MPSLTAVKNESQAAREPTAVGGAQLSTTMPRLAEIKDSSQAEHEPTVVGGAGVSYLELSRQAFRGKRDLAGGARSAREQQRNMAVAISATSDILRCPMAGEESVSGAHGAEAAMAAAPDEERSDHDLSPREYVAGGAEWPNVLNR